MMSADRSVAVGAALLGLGGAAVIARLAYDWAANGHFWSVWTVLGVVIGGLGLVIMVVGWVMPSKESLPRQVQLGGNGSTNIQAGRDITLPRDGQSEE
jgi:hypothetical protein